MISSNFINDYLTLSYFSQLGWIISLTERPFNLIPDKLNLYNNVFLGTTKLRVNFWNIEVASLSLISG